MEKKGKREKGKKEKKGKKRKGEERRELTSSLSLLLTRIYFLLNGSIRLDRGDVSR